MTMREEFEKDAEPYGFVLTKSNCPCCTYEDMGTEIRFQGFEAGYIACQKAMRERAATPDFHRKYVECKIIRALPIEGE